MKPTPDTIFRELRSFLAGQVNRDLEELGGEPGGSKAKWLLEHLGTLKPRERRR